MIGVNGVLIMKRAATRAARAGTHGDQDFHHHHGRGRQSDLCNVGAFQAAVVLCRERLVDRVHPEEEEDDAPDGERPAIGQAICHDQGGRFLSSERVLLSLIAGHTQTGCVSAMLRLVKATAPIVSLVAT